MKNIVEQMEKIEEVAETATLQDIVEQDLLSIFTRIRTDWDKNKAAFKRLSTKCKYNCRVPGYKNRRGCKKIQTPSLHECSMQNCPYLRKAWRR